MALRTLLSACLLAAAALAAAAPASARIVEIGLAAAGETPPSCPASPCQAISRTTGYQAKVGEQRGLFVAPARGRIVAWSVTLGNPGAEQRRFFDGRLGGAASAGITILRPGKRLGARVVGQSPVVPLEPYFGTSVQFPLEQTLFVKKGYVVAITVPTWAPILSLGLPNTTSWRASRPSEPREKCLDTETQTAQSRVGGITRFRCLYKTARLTYSATMVTAPSEPQR